MKPEVQALLQKARESVDAARLLCEKSYWDFAASRTYYALFYTAEALLLEKGLSFSSHSAGHRGFWKGVREIERARPEVPSLPD